MIAVILCFWGLRTIKPEKASPVFTLHERLFYRSLFIVSLGLIIILPRFYIIAPILWSSGILLQPVRKRFPVFSSLADALWLCSLVLLFQVAAMPLVYFFGARYHQISFLHPLVCSLLRIAGLRITSSNGSLFVQTISTTSKITITLERLGFFPFLLYLFGGLALLFLTSHGWKRITRFILILTGYCTFRFLLLLLISIEWNNPVVFWSSIITSLSFLPLPFLLTELLPFSPYSSPGDFSNENIPENKIIHANEIIHANKIIHLEFIPKRETFQFGGALFICIVSIIFALGFHDPGMRKQGRILIDEQHSNWEWTDIEFNTQIFGKKTDYNFYCMSKYLSYFYSVKRNHRPLTPHILEDTDVLILKTPTQEYTDEEREAIVNFVGRGGGLFLIGDHTNVFGMSTYLNKIARRFNLCFRYDVTYDLPTYNLSLYRKPDLFAHPAVERVPVFLFGSSCTLSIPLKADSVITGYGLRNHYLDYSQKNFFPIPEEDSDYEFGLFIQSAAVTYKKGRVLAFTDSTCFSNFFVFIPGKPELLLGSVEWLNRKNKFGFIKLIFFFLGVGGLIYLLISWQTKKEYFLPGTKKEYFLGIALLFGLAAILTGIVAVRFINQKNYEPPAAQKDFFRLAVDSEYSSLFLPVTRLAETSDKSFLTFFVWSQRLGFVPNLAPTLNSAMTTGNAVILIDPARDFPPDQTAALKNYLLKGGAVLLLDTPQNQQSKANQILREFDMTIDYHNSVKGALFDNNAQPVGEIDQAHKIEGGDSLLADQGGNSVLSVKKFGAGLITVFTASHLFRDESIGYTNSVPDEYQHWLSKMEFWLLSSLAKKTFIPFSAYSSMK
ncbi:MAG: DUF4350 domain-containing protein [bacterium]